MNKPEWKDAPKWADHLWEQAADNRYCWSLGEDRGTKALWASDKDNATNQFHLWPECWTYVEGRP